jgi:hypothetical protein
MESGWNQEEAMKLRICDLIWIILFGRGFIFGPANANNKE